MPRGPRRHPLRTKIIAWSFIPTAIILLLVALTTYQAYRGVTEEVVVKQDEELTRLSATELSAGYEDYIDRLTSLARLPEVYQGLVDNQQAALEANKNKLIFFDTGVFILNNFGAVSASLPKLPSLKGKDWSDRPFFKKLVETSGTVFSNIEPDGPQGEDVIVLAVPIMNTKNEFQGVVLGMFRLDVKAVSPFYGNIIKLRLGRSGTAVIVDGDYRIIYSSDFSQIGRLFIEEPLASEAFGGDVGTLRFQSSAGQDVIAGYAPVPRTDWTLMVYEDWNTMIGTAIGYGRFLWVLLALGVLIPTIVVMIGVQRITGPVEAFRAAAQRIAGGDFQHTVQIHTHDELEDLADQFNAMAGRLQESYAALERRVAQRTQELEALNDIAAVVSRSLDLNQILPDALKKTIEIMGMDGGAILRLEEDQETLGVTITQGLDNDFISVIGRYPLHSSVIRHVMASGQPVARYVSDYPPSPLKTALEQFDWKVVVSIPIVAQEKVLGAINVVSHQDSLPSQESLAVPATIGQEIGVALEHARLYVQTLDYAHQMEAARLTAEKANAAKSDFLANVSHELRTPLVSILGFTRVAQKRLQERIFPLLPQEEKTQKAASQVDENLGIILSEGQRLTTMINHLLDLEKIEAGKMEWASRPLDIAAAVERASTATASLFEDKPIELVNEVPHDLPQVNGDPDKLVQVIINLISNAVKFTPQGKISLRAHTANNFIIVSVSDQGIGIAQPDQAIVFDKFTQISDPLEGKPRGTGLGLSISKEIVEHHGGRIWVESAQGQGSTFSFSLPVASEPVPAQAEK